MTRAGRIFATPIVAREYGRGVPVLSGSSSFFRAIRAAVWVLAALSGSSVWSASNAPADRLDASVVQMKTAEDAYQAGRWPDAMQQYEELVRAFPKNPFLLFRYGNAASQLGIYENAAQAYHSALVLDPNYAEAAFNLGLVRLSQSDAAFAHAVTKAQADSRFGAEAQRMRGLTQRIIRVTANGDDGVPVTPADATPGQGSQ